VELLESVYESGDIKWMVPAATGALIVLFGLVRLLFSESVSWALAFLIVFGGVLSGASVITKASIDQDGFGIETVAALGEAGQKLKDAVSANTEAIEGMQSAISEIRTFAEMLAAAGSETQGELALTDTEIARFRDGLEKSVSDTRLAINRSRDAETAAVRNLEIVTRAVEQQRILPVQ